MSLSNPFILIAHFSQTPKSKLYLGNCCLRREYTRREGKWALSYWAVAKILLRSSISFISLPCTSFCRGFWYQEATKAWRRLYGVAGEMLWCNAKASSWIHDRLIEWKIFFPFKPCCFIIKRHCYTLWLRITTKISWDSLSEAPNENIVQNHLNMALLNAF